MWGEVKKREKSWMIIRFPARITGGVVPLVKMHNKESAELAGAPLITTAHNLPAEGGFQCLRALSGDKGKGDGKCWGIMS